MMSEPDNDSVSQFFRNAVRKPQIRFREDDWKKMEAMLDASPPSVPIQKRGWGRAAISVATVLLLSGLILFVSVRDQKSLSGDVKSQSPETKSGKSEREESGSPMVTNNDSRPTARAIAFDRKLLSPMPSEQAQPFEVPDNEKSQHVDYDQPQMHQSTESEIKTDSVPDKPVTDYLVLSDTVSSADSIPSDKKSSVPSKWSMMVAVSPDFTSPGLHKFTSPGKAAAVVLFYHLNNAISLSAGIVASNKNYWDTGTNYKTVDENFWTKKTNGMVADKALGSCSMLEIPLGLRYNFHHTERSNVFASAQVSSYFMFNESYQYVFKSPNPGALNEWHAPKRSRSLFGVVNLAVGFERAISRRMMIGISPYVNIPLTNMGAWSNVKLYSLGTAFTFRYKFQRRSIDNINRPD